MFRAIKLYDGSDTSKCINLTPGDTLSSVHSLDETWFIGFNERSGEIGAFPIACVEAIGNEYGPLPGKDSDGHKMDEKAIYANVSMQIQARKATEAKSIDDIDHKERSRSLSIQAKSFDTTKLMGTKPEKSFRLTLVKKDDSGISSSGVTESHPEDSSLAQPEEVFSLENGTQIEDAEEQHVRFAEVALEHSISVAYSTDSWQDSFEMSYDRHDQDLEQSNTSEAQAPKDQNEDGKWHKLKRSSLQSSTEKLNRSDSTNSVTKILIAATACFVILGLLYTILVFSFRYTFITAGAVVGVSAIFMAVGIAFSPLCRCVLVILLPNMFAGKGRAVFLAILFGFLLSYPILNISHNLVETGRSLTCLTEIAVNQSNSLDRQLAQPSQQKINLIDKQRADIRQVSSNTTEAFDNLEAHMDTFYGSLDTINTFLGGVVKECEKSFDDIVNYCITECVLAGSAKNQCLQACSLMVRAKHRCNNVSEPLRAAFINSTVTVARSAIEGVHGYFIVGIYTISNFDNHVNKSDIIKAAHDTKDAGQIVTCVALVVDVLVKLLSIILVIGFLQSFLYSRNYLSQDGFDNIYITEEFRTLDITSDVGNKVLPLKEREKKVYIDTSCCQPGPPEVAHCMYDAIHVLLYVMICSFVVFFDIALYCILTGVSENDDVNTNTTGLHAFQVNVTGDSHLVEYYRVILKTFNFRTNYFTISSNTTMCTPSARNPTLAVIPVLACVLVFALTCVVLRGYWMRLRRAIMAYHYPEQERARLEYLRRNIQLRRNVFLSSLSLQIDSSHREYIAKRKYGISIRLLNTLTRIERCLPALGRCIPKLSKLECSGCKQTERVSRLTTLKKCRGEYDGALCETVYCDDCRQALKNSCPVCLKDETDSEIY